MNINLSKTSVITSFASMIVGVALGGFGVKYYDVLHTPEETIRRLEAEKAEHKASSESLEALKKETNAQISELKRTKKQYQDEIRPELESKIRTELETYISKADATYEKAKYENDMASLKLKLADSQAKQTAFGNASSIFLV